MNHELFMDSSMRMKHINLDSIVGIVRVFITLPNFFTLV